MLLVPAFINPSGIHGIGCFTKEPIAKGTIIWKFQEGFDVVITPDVTTQLSGEASKEVQHYAYEDKNTKQLILCSDDSRFFNHSVEPNTA